MAVLYRKYRPQTFAEILNQKPIIQTLKSQVAGGSVAHAYLFTGSRGVGKTSVARILAKAVNCTHQTPTTPSRSAGHPSLAGGEATAGDACGECEVCKAIEQGNFLDLVEVDAASNTGVDNIRELIDHVRFSPSAGRYKVFIIDEVHMLSKGAFNALLKTLEEPPQHAIFILATTEINKVPATIVSRTQRFDFKAYSAADLLPLLEKICKAEQFKFSKEVLEIVAQNAEGSARDALSLLDKISTLGNNASLSDARQLLGITDISLCKKLLELIALGQAAELPEFFGGLSEKGLDYVIFNRDFLEFLRKVLVFKVTGGAIKPQIDGIEDLAGKLLINEIIFIVRLFLKSYKDLSASPDQEIPLLLAGLEAALRKSPPTSFNIEALSSKQASTAHRQAESVISDQKSEIITKPSPPVPSEIIGHVQAITDQVADYHVMESAASMSLPEVMEVWPKVISKIKAVNSPLASMLKGSELIGVEGSKIVLGVKFLFDKQNLENHKNAALISETFQAITGKTMAITGRVTKEIKPANSNTVEVLSQALQVFGGELIE